MKTPDHIKWTKGGLIQEAEELQYALEGVALLYGRTLVKFEALQKELEEEFSQKLPVELKDLVDQELTRLIAGGVTVPGSYTALMAAPQQGLTVKLAEVCKAIDRMEKDEPPGAARTVVNMKPAINWQCQPEPDYDPLANAEDPA